MTPEEVAQAWAQAYAGPAQSNYQAPSTTNYSNLSAGIGQDVLSHMQNTQMWAPFDNTGAAGQWGYEGGTSQTDPRRLVYHAQGQGAGENYATFDPTTGAFLKNETGSKPMSYAQGVLSVLGAAVGAEAAFGGVGAAGTTGYATGGLAGGGGAGAGAGGAGVTGLPSGSEADAFWGAAPEAAPSTAGGGVTGFGDSGTMYAGNTAADAATLGGGASVNGGAALSSGGGISLSDALKTASKVYGQMGQQQTAQAQTPIPGLQDNRPSSYVGPAPGYAPIASAPTKSPMLGGLNNPWGSPYMTGLMGMRNGY